MLFRLPRESWFMQATLGEPARWSTTDYLLAQVIDAVNAQRVQLLQVKGVRPKPKFEPFPRPGDNPDKGKSVYGRGGGVPVEVMRVRLQGERDDG